MLSRANRLTFFVLTLALICAPAWAIDNPLKNKVVSDFSRFCAKHFGAEKEPLIYDKVGKTLKLLDDGSWMHVSENSACIAWETNLPATSYVEYGETPAFGKKSTVTERPFYLHIHYLKDLKTGTAYHYRLLAVDERGNRLVTTAKTLTPKAIPGAVHVPGDMGKPPYNLEKQDTTYVLTEDIVSDGTPLNVMNTGITLDLNGHAVVYNNAPGVASAPPANIAYATKGAPGIRGNWVAANAGKTRILNGFIHQGKGAGGFKDRRANAYCAPLMLKTAEVAGLTVSYSGVQVSGMRSGLSHVHHNVTIDTGVNVGNRHQGTGAVAGGTKVHHNLIKRCRHCGIRPYSESKITHNEIYMDSCATNAAGVFLYRVRDSLVKGNRIFGTGYYIMGIGPMGPMRDDVSNLKIHSNIMHFEMTKPSAERSSEYGAIASARCFRLTWGGKHIDVARNLAVANGRDGASVKGTWLATNMAVRNAVFRDNIFKTIYRGNIPSTFRNSCAIGLDGTGHRDGEPIVIRNNTIISNITNVDQAIPKGGEKKNWSGGPGGSVVFEGNRFVRVGNRRDYKTINYSAIANYIANGAKYYDSTFEGGAGYDKFGFLPRSKRKYGVWPIRETKMDFSIGWTVTLRTAPNAKVTVTDKSGAEVFTGNADAQGKLDVKLLQLTRKAVGTEDEVETIHHTPHTVTVELGGRKTTKTVTADARKDIALKP